MSSDAVKCLGMKGFRPKQIMLIILENAWNLPLCLEFCWENPDKSIMEEP